jgi:fatty-acyl-CoA synthase
MLTIHALPRWHGSLAEIRRAMAAIDVADLPRSNTYDLIRATARIKPRSIAVRVLHSAAPADDFSELTYAELVREITRAANLFRQLGIGPGDAVLFLAVPTLEALIAFWGAQAAGAVNPVNPFLSVDAIAEIARETGARVLFASGAGVNGACAQKARDLLAICPQLAACVTDGADGPIAFSAARAACASDRIEGPACAPDDICAYFPTGGTTGAPKVARISHFKQCVGAMSMALAQSIDGDQVVPNGLPLFHVGGGILSTTRSLLLGHTLVQLTPAGFRTPGMLEHFWALARQHGFTQLITVPTTFSDLLRSYDGAPVPIRLFVAGASKLPETLCAAYERAFGVGIHEGYGMTECAGFCTVNPSALSPRPGSGGLVSPFYRVRTVRRGADGRIVADCEAGESGLIVVRGPAVFEGYTNAAKTAEKFVTDAADGRPWLDSGDLGYFDADSYLWITGRAKDVIIRGGHNIDPAGIEEVLSGYPGVVAAAAVGMPDARVGELPVAFVEWRPDRAFDEAAMRAHCSARLTEAAATPVRIIALPALPRTAMQKVFKPELRRQAAEMAVTAEVARLPAAVVGFQTRVACDPSGSLTVEVVAPQGLPAELRLELRDAFSRLGLRSDFAADGSSQ